MVKIKILVDNIAGEYNKGEIISVDKKSAESLIKEGCAELVKPKIEKKKKIKERKGKEKIIKKPPKPKKKKIKKKKGVKKEKKDNKKHINILFIFKNEKLSKVYSEEFRKEGIKILHKKCVIGIQVMFDFGYFPAKLDDVTTLFKKGLLDVFNINDSDLKKIKQSTKNIFSYYFGKQNIPLWKVDKETFTKYNIQNITQEGKSDESDKPMSVERLKLRLPELIGSNDVDKNDIRYRTAVVLSQNDHFACMRDNEELYYYNHDDGIYRENGEVIAKEKVRRIWRSFAMRNDINEILETIKQLNYDNRKNFNTAVKLPMKNGILDMETKELEEFSPNKKFTFALPVEYDSKADCPKIKKFISEVVDKDNIPLIQEMVGYCLLQDYPFSKSFMLIGTGANGKSVLLNLLVSLLGEENISNTSLQELCYNRFALQELYGKLANIHNELPSSEITNSGHFKMLTGNDLIRAEKKHRNAFKFRNHAKLIFACNELPRSADTTPAFFRRWIIIKFPNTFDGKNEDTKILDKLLDKKELSGLLNWGLEGLERIKKRNKFSMTLTREEIENEWVLQTDSLMAFVNKSVEYEQDGIVTKKVFYECYTGFCDDYDLSAIENNVVGRRLKTILPKVRAEKPKIGGSQKPSWIGIKINLGKSQERLGGAKIPPLTDTYIKDSKDISTYKGLMSNVYNSKQLANSQESSCSNNLDNLDIKNNLDIRLQAGRILEFIGTESQKSSDDLVLYDDILIFGNNLGIDEEKFQEILKELKSKGKIYEAKHNQFKIVD